LSGKGESAGHDGSALRAAAKGVNRAGAAVKS